MMIPEFSDAPFKMKKGTFSSTPVKTEFGYHVIFVEDFRDTKPLDLAEVEPQIKAGLAQEAIGKIVEDLNKNADVQKFDLKGKKIEAK